MNNEQQNYEMTDTVDTVSNQTKKKKKKKIIIFSVIAIVLLLLIVSLTAGDSDDNKIEPISTSPNDNISEIQSSINNIVEAGNSITTKNFKISYISCDSNYRDYDEFSTPKSGNKIVRAEFNFENISSTDQFVSGFECYADNNKCEAYFWADDASVAFDSISPGRTINYILYYEVPENAAEIELELEDNIRSGEKIKFIVK